MQKPGWHIRGATLINEDQQFRADVFVANNRILKIVPEGETWIPETGHTFEIFDAKDLLMIPGAIDDQVHFREPGLTHKGDISSESRAAAAGGITTYFEMPNTQPQTTTRELLEAKYKLAENRSWVNYGFFFGGTNENLSEILQLDPAAAPGLKLFMGSSTGNMLVDNRETLENIFREYKGIIALHCEDEQTIRENSEEARVRFGEDVPMEYHPIIRSEQACYKSSSMAVELAVKHNTRIHILHISTALETSLFRNDIPLAEKRITAEACVHHLWFTDEDYPRLGSRIKWNPAVKSKIDRDAVWEALLDNRIDILATDHAPHTLEEKSNPYFSCPSGGPLVQHAIPATLEWVRRGKLSYAQAVRKMCHNPADLFRVKDRGYLREGYYADFVLINPNNSWTVVPENILYKCGWSPFEGVEFAHRIQATFVNGNRVYFNGAIENTPVGQRAEFA